MSILFGETFLSVIRGIQCISYDPPLIHPSQGLIPFKLKYIQNHTNTVIRQICAERDCLRMNPVNIVNHPPKKMDGFVHCNTKKYPKVSILWAQTGTPIATTRRLETLCRTFWRRAATSRTSWSNKSESEATRSVKLVRLFPQETKIKEVSPNFRTSAKPPPIFQESDLLDTHR